MKQDKTKILSDLYAIRATMSVVAMNDDEAEKERGAITDCDASISSLREEIESKKIVKRNELSKFTINHRIDELKNELETTENDYIGLKKEYNNTQAHCKKMFISRYFGCWLDMMEDLFEDHLILAVLMVINFLFLILYGIILLFVAIPRAIHDKKTDLMLFREYQNRMDICERRIFCFKSEISALQRRYEKGHLYIDCIEVTHAEQKLQSFEKETNQQITLLQQKIPNHKTTIRTIAQKSQKIIDSAAKTYSLIDFRDWENVDLIIYYFETGRADDMKEALQLVDRQRQTDQITRTIAIASKDICRTFNDSMRRLGSALSQSFSVLSRQMTQQHIEMMSGMERQAEEQRKMNEAQIREIRAQTAEQRNAQAMNQALLNKISVSSLHLAEQMDRQMEEVYGLY